MSFNMTYIDKDHTEATSMGSIQHIVIDSTHSATISLELNASGKKNTIKEVQVSPVSANYTLTIQAKMDGTNWVNMITPVTNVGLETVMNRIDLKNWKTYYPVQCLITTTSETEIDLYILIWIIEHFEFAGRE